MKLTKAMKIGDTQNSRINSESFFNGISHVFFSLLTCLVVLGMSLLESTKTVGGN